MTLCVLERLCLFWCPLLDVCIQASIVTMPPAVADECTPKGQRGERGLLFLLRLCFSHFQRKFIHSCEREGAACVLNACLTRSSASTVLHEPVFCWVPLRVISVGTLSLRPRLALHPLLSLSQQKLYPCCLEKTRADGWLWRVAFSILNSGRIQPLRTNISAPEH